MTTPQATPPGWYPDPQNPAQQRYWDGSAWSEATQPLAGAAPAPAYQQPAGYGFAQGVGPDYAGFGARLAALIIDGLIIGVPLWIAAVIAAAIADSLVIIVYLIGLGVYIWYWGTYEGGPEGQTIGKKTLGIRTVDAVSLQPGIGMGRAIGRLFARILSGLICYLGYLWMLWDPEKQTWHDKIATTKVIKA